jgi:ABC-type uncharacterized transport system substrate-binding protein
MTKTLSIRHPAFASDNRKSAIQNPKWWWVFSGIAFVLMVNEAGAHAQQSTKVPRIGYLTGTSLSANSARTDAFRQGLRELGYIEGTSIVIDWRSADGKADRLPVLAAELVRLKEDIIVTGGPTSNRAAKDATITVCRQAD